VRGDEEGDGAAGPRAVRAGRGQTE
jgi:hypothetical protein